MQISKKALNNWRKNWERGDNQELAKILQMDEASVSRILNGKQETTSTVLLQIRGYFKKKRDLKKNLEKEL